MMLTCIVQLIILDLYFQGMSLKSSWGGGGGMKSVPPNNILAFLTGRKFGIAIMVKSVKSSKVQLAFLIIFVNVYLNLLSSFDEVCWSSLYIFLSENTKYIDLEIVLK